MTATAALALHESSGTRLQQQRTYKQLSSNGRRVDAHDFRVALPARSQSARLELHSLGSFLAQSQCMRRRSFSLLASALTHTRRPLLNTRTSPVLLIAMASTRATRSFLKAADSKEAASEAAASPSSAAALFTPLRAPAARSQRKRGADAAADADADAAETEAGAADVVEEQVSQEQEEAEEAAATEQASASAADAKQGPNPAKRQKLAEESKATIPDAPPAAAAAASSASAAPGAVARTSPDALSFPASLLNEPVSSYAAAFDAIARNMLFDLELHSNGHVMRVLEMEIYYKGVPNPAVKDGGHVDLFAHAHPVQAANYGNCECSPSVARGCG